MPLTISTPKNAIVGINYSGMHDSTVVVVDKKGETHFASSLERLSRCKQDGRPPYELLNAIDWNKVEAVAVSTNQKIIVPDNPTSKFHPVLLPYPRTSEMEHSEQFYTFLNTIKAPIFFYGHQHCHIASSYYLSGFDSALGLTYDGGMQNETYFGGFFDCKGLQIKPIDMFSSSHYAKITSLYTIVTAILGFTPNKHEGKITGLAAFGKPTKECRDYLNNLLCKRYYEIESAIDWIYAYDMITPPIFYVLQTRIEKFRKETERFSKEEMAATVQAMAEEHILELLKSAREAGVKNDSLCLSGGLFANVKINQRAKEAGFKNIFICPAMTDDGTALGAALAYCAQKNTLKKNRVPHVFLGANYSTEEVEKTLQNYGATYSFIASAEDEIAQALNKGLSVAVYQDAAEFGPRALGHRSVLASAEHPDINKILNKKFHRTEFMPFAPMTLWEDAEMCYKNIEGAKHAAEFMTITFDCHDTMKKLCPAVVHVDGTARPQLVRKEVNPFIHKIITIYKKLSGRPAIINTSYNMHEEPIIGSPDDAIRGFFESGIDVLYIGGFLVYKENNYKQAAEYMQSQISAPTQKEKRNEMLLNYFEKNREAYYKMCVEKESVIQDLIKKVSHTLLS